MPANLLNCKYYLSSSCTQPQGLLIPKGDTLMLIALSVYGDHRRWREIYNLNRNTINNNFVIKPGIILKYYGSKNADFYNRPDGNPYLIKTGDSLSIII